MLRGEGREQKITKFLSDVLGLFEDTDITNQYCIVNGVINLLVLGSSGSEIALGVFCLYTPPVNGQVQNVN